MQRFSLTTLSLLSALSFSTTAHDHSHNLSAHQHGIGHLDLAIDGDHLLIELRSPAADLLGFEHAPRNAAEREQLELVMEALRQGGRLFKLPTTAQCELEEVHLDSPLFEVDDHSGHDGHQHNEHGDHADITAQYAYRCASAEALREMEVNVFAVFPGTEVLKLQAITAEGQQGGELTATSNMVRF